MAFPIITLLLALLVAFFGFQTGSLDTGMTSDTPAAVSAPADDEAADEE